MKIKTSELTDAALDWAVAKCEGIPAEELYIQKWGSRLPPSIYRRNRDEDGNLDGSYTTGPDLLFSRKWEAGGPIIDRMVREGLRLTGYKSLPTDPTSCQAQIGNIVTGGQTPLIAAMRVFVSYKLGNEVDVPDELL